MAGSTLGQPSLKANKDVFAIRVVSAVVVWGNPRKPKVQPAPWISLLAAPHNELSGPTRSCRGRSTRGSRAGAPCPAGRGEVARHDHLALLLLLGGLLVQPALRILRKRKFPYKEESLRAKLMDFQCGGLKVALS